jgi:hypothetical protein
LGRWASRVLVWGLVLSIAALVLLIAQGSDAFVIVLLVVAVFGYANAALPAALFVIYAGRQPPPELPRNMRQAVWVSAVVLMLFGAWLFLGVGSPLPMIAGAAGATLGVVAIVRIVRFTPPAASDARLAYGRSTAVGIFLSLLILLALPKFACGCGDMGKAYQSQVRSELQNLLTTEEMFFSSHHRYALLPEIRGALVLSAEDSIVVVTPDTSGWWATGTNEHFRARPCGIWVGVRPPDGMHGAKEGEPVCWKT